MHHSFLLCVTLSQGCLIQMQLQNETHRPFIGTPKTKLLQHDVPSSSSASKIWHWKTHLSSLYPFCKASRNNWSEFFNATLNRNNWNESARLFPPALCRGKEQYICDADNLLLWNFLWRTADHLHKKYRKEPYFSPTCGSNDKTTENEKFQWRVSPSEESSETPILNLLLELCSTRVLVAVPSCLLVPLSSHVWLERT